MRRLVDLIAINSFDKRSAVMRAKDIMSRTIISVSPSHSVKHAARIMLENRVSGLPVLEDFAKPVGVITEGDLLRRAELGPVFSSERENEAENRSEAKAANFVRKHSWKVGDVMSSKPITIDGAMPLSMIAETMLRHKVKRLLVICDTALIGIVSRADLLPAIVTAREDRTAAGDEAIHIAVLTRLRTDLGLSPDTTAAMVEDGRVLLWGQVLSNAEHEAARVAAEGVRGVVGVTNNLRIATETDFRANDAQSDKPV